MNKDYYSILQINRNASPEIIEKAYKTLAKKYHPDLQQSEESKKEAEEILKNINEAYDVLSDKYKKQKYDSTLYDNTISKEDFNKLYEQNQILKNKINNLQNNYNINHLSNSNIDKQNISYEKKSKKDYSLKEKKQALELKKQIEQAKRQAYYDAYIQDLKNRGYTIKYKKTFKDYIRYFITIVVIILVFFILWQIPFIHDYITDLFESNELLKFIKEIF